MGDAGLVECEMINPLKAELNPICHLLALLGAHHVLHVSRIRVKAYTLVVGKLKETVHLEDTHLDGR